MSAKVVTDPLIPALGELVHASLAMTTVAETLGRVTRKLEASDALMAWEVVSRGAFGEGLRESNPEDLIEETPVDADDLDGETHQERYAGRRVSEDS